MKFFLPLEVTFGYPILITKILEWLEKVATGKAPVAKAASGGGGGGHGGH
jgi:hypothetical protein